MAQDHGFSLPWGLHFSVVCMGVHLEHAVQVVLQTVTAWGLGDSASSPPRLTPSCSGRRFAQGRGSPHVVKILELFLT